MLLSTSSEVLRLLLGGSMAGLGSLGVLRLWAGVLAGPGRLGSWLVCRRAVGRVHAWGPGPGAVEIWCRGGTGGACSAGRQVAPGFCRWSLLLRSPLCGRGLNVQVGVVFPSVVE